MRPQSSRRSISSCRRAALAVQRLDAFVLGRSVAAAQRQGLGEQPDRRERRAQLVRYLGDEVALQARQIGFAPHEHPDQDDSGHHCAAQREHQNPHQRLNLRLSQEQEHGSDREQQHGRHDHQRHQQDDDAPVAEGSQVSRGH